MSLLDKMSIMGIRSFNPNEEQQICFFTPLTLILGPNGTGKTTIIECLKYMTTGDLPPNSNKGQSFVHDPKMAHETQVNSKIKLMFRNVHGKQIQVSRLLQATQKAKKLEFKTLDGTITKRGPDGKPVSLTSRCADIDREMVNMLGVSKAILEYVIFCHQEDSNWPLSDSRTLKEKFDDIFAATKYIKALEDIRKVRIGLQNDVKMISTDIKYLKQNKEQAEKLNKELTTAQSRQAACQDNVAKIKEKINPMEIRLVEIKRKENEIAKVQTEIAKKETHLSENIKSCQELKAQIKNEHQGTIEELQTELSNFRADLNDKKRSLKQLERENNIAGQEYERLNKKRSPILVQIGKLENEIEQQENRIKERDTRAKVLHEEFAEEDLSEDYTPVDILEKTLKVINNKITALEMTSRDTKKEWEEKEFECQGRLDELRDKKTRLETQRANKQKQLKLNQKELMQVRKDLAKVDSNAANLNQVNDELKRAELELAEVEGSVNVNELKGDIQKLSVDTRKIEDEIRVLDAELKKMHTQSSLQAELDILKKDKIAKDESINRLRTQHQESLQFLLNSEEVPQQNLSNVLNKFITSEEKQLREQRGKVQQKELEKSKKENNRKMFQEQLSKVEKELKTYEDKIFDVCGTQNFDTSLQQVTGVLKNLQNEKGVMEGSEYVHKNFIEQLKERDAKCPLCHRGFEEAEEAEALVVELDDKIRRLPTQLDAKKKKIAENEEKKVKMLKLEPVRSKITDINENEIPSLRQKIKDLEKDIGRCEEDLTDLKENLNLLQENDQLSKDILVDAKMIDNYQAEVRTLERKISKLTSQLGNSNPDRTVTIVQNEKEAKHGELDTLKIQLNQKQKKFHEHTEELQTKRTRVNDLKTEKLQIQEDLQKRNQLEERLSEILADNETCNKEIKQAEEDVAPIEDNLTEIRTEKAQITKNKERALSIIAKDIKEVSSKLNELKMLDDQIQKFVNDGFEEALENRRSELQELDVKRAEAGKTYQDKGNKIQEVNQELAQAEVRERELSDCLQLWKKKQEADILEDQIKVLKDRIAGMDTTTIFAEKKSLSEELERLNRERHTEEGRFGELKKQIRSLETDLNKEQFRDAERQHREKIIGLKTTELAADDLNKYYQALDKAVMSYHRLKMCEVNKIIRELWRNTYRGDDYDYIEIRSEADDSTSGLDKKRSYNYKVVMVRDDTSFDMRGHCSAGQKVLASLVIRLALAETFGAHCGILALDEPTTNLDRDNIESLAIALADIVKAREKQKNFQLIIITHDEDFMDLLGRSEFADRYCRVSKDQRGYSTLNRCSLNKVR